MPLLKIHPRNSDAGDGKQQQRDDDDDDRAEKRLLKLLPLKSHNLHVDGPDLENQPDTEHYRSGSVEGE